MYIAIKIYRTFVRVPILNDLLFYDTILTQARACAVCRVQFSWEPVEAALLRRTAPFCVTLAVTVQFSLERLEAALLIRLHHSVGPWTSQTCEIRKGSCNV